MIQYLVSHSDYTDYGKTLTNHNQMQVQEHKRFTHHNYKLVWYNITTKTWIQITLLGNKRVKNSQSSLTLYTGKGFNELN